MLGVLRGLFEVEFHYVFYAFHFPCEFEAEALVEFVGAAFRSDGAEV